MKRNALCTLGLQSYRKLGNISLELEPLTILYGLPNSGKSSILEALLLIKQTLSEGKGDEPLKLHGSYVQLDSFDSIVNKHVGNNTIGIEVGVLKGSSKLVVKSNIKKSKKAGVHLDKSSVKLQWGGFPLDISGVTVSNNFDPKFFFLKPKNPSVASKRNKVGTMATLMNEFESLLKSALSEVIYIPPNYNIPYDLLANEKCTKKVIKWFRDVVGERILIKIKEGEVQIEHDGIKIEKVMSTSMSRLIALLVYTFSAKPGSVILIDNVDVFLPVGRLIDFVNLCVDLIQEENKMFIFTTSSFNFLLNLIREIKTNPNSPITAMQDRIAIYSLFTDFVEDSLEFFEHEVTKAERLTLEDGLLYGILEVNDPLAVDVMHAAKFLSLYAGVELHS